jgi:DNA polymerase III subunit delta'
VSAGSHEAGDALFQGIVGQGLALGMLRRALESRPSHAYLFAGPRGVGKSEAALAFAAGVCCRVGGCAECDTCRRIQEAIHPDVDIVSPEGSFITVEQIREVNREVALRPFEAAARVTIVLEAESMNKEAANAFLKTLEEPPPHAHFVLVTDAPESLLPTITSRCQRIPFTRTPTPLLAAHLREKFALPEPDAQAFARVAQGNLERARELAASEEAREQRARLLEWARQVPSSDLYATQVMLDDLLFSLEARAERRVEVLEEGRKRDSQWAGDARTRARVEKLYDQRVKRERRRALAEGVEEALQAFTGWYRDLAVTALGAEDAVLNHDYLYELRGQAFPARVSGYLGAVDAARRAEERFRYNVDARSVLQDMLLSMKEALT